MSESNSDNSPRSSRWLPGQSGNPAGRPRIGLSILENINRFDGTPLSELLRIANDPNSPSSEAAAAKWLTDLRDHRPTVRQRALDALLDRSIGKPVAPTIVAKAEADSPDVADMRLRLSAWFTAEDAASIDINQLSPEARKYFGLPEPDEERTEIAGDEEIESQEPI